MKKLMFMIIISVVLFALNSDTYLTYTNKLIHYGFNLKNFDKMHIPFEIQRPEKNANIRMKTINKFYKTILLSVLNNRACFLIKEYFDNRLIREYKKWVSVNDKIGKCVIIKISFSKTVLKCKHKLLIKTLDKKILGLKEKQ